MSGSFFPEHKNLVRKLQPEQTELDEGETLRVADVPFSALDGKILLLYFSAHWCGPCRHFTPSLAKWYQQRKAEKDDFELVYVPADSNQKEFDEYFVSHPWLALPPPFEAEKPYDGFGSALYKRFDVNGIPTLIVLDATPQRNVICTDGRRALDALGPAAFPWPVTPLRDVLAASAPLRPSPIDKTSKVTCVGDVMTTKSPFALFVASKYTADRAPQYLALRDAVRAGGNPDFEIICCCHAADEEEYEALRSTMPFPALERLAGIALCRSGAGLLSSFGWTEEEGSSSSVVPVLLNKDAEQVLPEEASPGALYPWKPLPPQPHFLWGPEFVRPANRQMLRNRQLIGLYFAGLGAGPRYEAVLSEFKALAEETFSAADGKHCFAYSGPHLAHRDKDVCPEGHPLTRKTIKPKTHGCDGCKEGVEGTEIQRCGKCDFDLCLPCYEKEPQNFPTFVGSLLLNGGDTSAPQEVAAARSAGGICVFVKAAGQRVYKIVASGGPELDIKEAFTRALDTSM